MESFVPVANYSDQETDYMLKKWNGRIAQSSAQFIDALTKVESATLGELLNVNEPVLDSDGNWVQTFKLNEVYTIGSLFKNSSVEPVPLYLEYANGIRFVPVVYIDNHPETFMFTTRKVDLGETNPTIHHRCKFLFAGEDKNRIPKDMTVQQIPAVEFPYHIEKFGICDPGSEWERLIVIPLFYKTHFYLMVLPQDSNSAAMAAKFLLPEHMVRFKKMIDDEYDERLLFVF